MRDLKGRKQNAVCTRANVDRSRHTNWLTKEDISEKNQCKYRTLKKCSVLRKIYCLHLPKYPKKIRITVNAFFLKQQTYCMQRHLQAINKQLIAFGVVYVYIHHFLRLSVCLPKSAEFVTSSSKFKSFEMGGLK